MQPFQHWQKAAGDKSEGIRRFPSDGTSLSQRHKAHHTRTHHRRRRDGSGGFVRWSRRRQPKQAALRKIQLSVSQLHLKQKLVDARRLPPTHSAAKFHSLRTHFQVQIWKRLESEKAMLLSVEDWESDRWNAPACLYCHCCCT